MLPKHNRLTHKEIASLQSQKPTTIIRSDILHLKIFIDSNTFKVSVAVSKKVSKKAVQRNTIRRVLYDVFKKYEAKLHQGMYILRVAPRAAECTKRQLRAELEQIIGRLIKAR